MNVETENPVTVTEAVKLEQPVKEKVIIEVHREILKDSSMHHAFIKRNGVKLAAYVYVGPTGDCQTFSISNVNTIIPSGDPELDMEILARCFQVSGKNQLLVNLCTDTTSMTRFKEIFKDNIVIEQNYISTRGSAMTMFLVRTSPLLKWLTENNKNGEIKLF